MSEADGTSGESYAEAFYRKAVKPNAPQTAAPPIPSATPATPGSVPAPETFEQRAERFYRTAHTATPADGFAKQDAPTTTAPSAPPPTAASAAETSARAADLRLAGVAVEGLSDVQIVAANDAAIKAHFAAQSAEIDGWEARTRAEVPQAEIASAQAFAATHLDDEIRGVLTSSGLGSHPGIVRLAAKLQAALSRG
jgi:hypothetical protein